MACLRRYRIMHGFLRRHDRRLGIERFEPPRIGHHGEGRPAFDWHGRGHGIGAKRLLLLAMIELRVMSVLCPGAFGLAQGLHQQAHSSPAGRAGTR
jgi:hypothetical protein